MPDLSGLYLGWRQQTASHSSRDRRQGLKPGAFKLWASTGFNLYRDPFPTVLAAQPAADGGLGAAVRGALEPAEAEQVAVLAAEPSPAVHLGARGHLAQLHPAVLDAQVARLGAAPAPRDVAEQVGI
jgi:hypothetical protein